MGYYTTFKLTWEKQQDYQEIPKCSHNPITKFCPDCGVQAGIISLDSAIAEFLDKNKDTYYGIDCYGNSAGSVKWYSWKEDMIEMSRVFPSVLFKLHGEGDENIDIWDAYFLNGKSQVKKAKIVIDECDPKGWE